MPDGGPWLIAAGLVSVAAALTALETIRRKALVPLWRFYRWLRHEVRDEIERRHKIDAIIERELTSNGGRSIKDDTTRSASSLSALTEKVEKVDKKLSDTRHDIIGKFTTLPMVVDGATTIVDALVTVADDLKSVHKDLEELKAK